MPRRSRLWTAACALGAVVAVHASTCAAQPAMETHCKGPAAEAMLAAYQGYARDVLNGAKRGAIANYFTDDYVWHDAPARTPPGAAAEARLMDVVFKAWPDRKVTTSFALCADDMLVVHQSLTGTNSGALLGYAPSGLSHTVRHTEIYRFRGGRIADKWGEGIIPLLLTRSGWKVAWPGDLAPSSANKDARP